jgi:hypothetical protein
MLPDVAGWKKGASVHSSSHKTWLSALPQELIAEATSDALEILQICDL